jgi:hypothetical protein
MPGFTNQPAPTKDLTLIVAPANVPIKVPMPIGAAAPASRSARRRPLGARRHGIFPRWVDVLCDIARITRPRLP